MTRVQKLLLGLLGISLAVLFLSWLLYAGEQYVLCLVNHWSGFHLFSDRQAVSNACISHLNPFTIFP